jgi:hypothetical protein
VGGLFGIVEFASQKGQSEFPIGGNVFESEIGATIFPVSISTFFPRHLSGLLVLVVVVVVLLLILSKLL